MDILVEAHNLNKTYKSKSRGIIKAVDDISLQIREREIYGLIGPNGAGKSTLIKLLLGLITPDSGLIEISGLDVSKNQIEVYKNIGAIIESPSFNNALTGRDNLKYLSIYQGGVNMADIDYALELVGLLDRANDKFSQYSLGMKQRLGLAQAIMHKPKFLILDEPTNGMDPNWIITVRKLFKNLVDELGLSILISSHILGELQLLCDRFGVISQGKLVGETTKEQLDGISANIKQIVVKCDNLQQAVSIIKMSEFSESFSINTKTGELIFQTHENQTKDIVKLLVMNGIGIEEVAPNKSSVEDFFNLAIREG